MDIGFYSKYFEVEKNHWLMRVRRGIVEDNLKNLFTKKNNEVKILDFGCGSGLGVGELQEIGYDVSGIDISSEAINFGLSKGIRNLKVQDFYKIDFPDASFDCVLALDVLEHLEDTSWAVKEINRVLKSDGKFIIMVPAYMFLWGVQDEVAHHYRRYTLGMLKKDVLENGKFEVKVSSYFNTLLFIPIALVRLLSRLFNLKKRQSDFDLSNPVIDKIFFHVFNFERKLLKSMSFPFGVSILLVLEKK